MVSRGEIYWGDMPEAFGSEQGGRRPVVVIQNDVNNRSSPTTIVAAVTSQPRQQTYPFHVLVTSRESGLPQDSTVLCEQLRTVAQTRLGARIGILPALRMRDVDKALVWSLGLREVATSWR